MKIKEKFNDQKLNIKFTFVIVILISISIGILSVILFRNMEKNVIHENLNYMEYTMQRNQDAIQTKIDSINMSTQFFLSDDSLQEVLYRTAAGEELSVEEWIAFKEEDVSALERLVNNNPLLYGVRVYAVTDNVKEMMPILYQRSRMNKQPWAVRTSDGWKFNYSDNVFASYTMQQKHKLIGLVTSIMDEEGKKIGTIESVMTMDNMFPSLYEEIENEWGCFYTNDGLIYFGDKESPVSREMLHEIYNGQQAGDELSTVYLEAEGRKIIVSSMQVKELSGSLLCIKDITESVDEVVHMRNSFTIVMVLMVILLAFLINQIVKGLLHQLYEILKSIRQVQNGDLNVVIENCGNDEMGELGSQINTMLERIRQLMEDNLNRKMLAKNSEIRALQNQINAHFIYNVLESIKMMAEIDEKYEISDAVTALGNLLRYSMKWTFIMHVPTCSRIS